MRVEAIVACIMTVLVAALYQSYPFECDEAAASLGRAFLRLVGPPHPPSRGVGETALMMSSASGNLAMVGFLLDQGGDPNRQDQDGNTALMRAAVGGHLAVVDLLLEKGADVNLQTAQGGTALMHASYGGHVQVVRRLLSSCSPHHSCLSTRLLDAWDGTALMRAADRGHDEVVQAILDLMPPVDRPFVIDAQAKYDGYTAMMKAAVNGHAECVQIIASFGASLLVSNAFGKNVLTVAREAKQPRVLEVLMRLGARETLAVD